MSQIKVSTDTQDLDTYTNDYTGIGEEYDQTKKYSNHENNRDFVWPLKMMISFILNILLGYPIPPITICDNKIIDGGNRTTTLWLFRNNKFTVPIDGEEYDYTKLRTNIDLYSKWLKSRLILVLITNATSEQVAQIFENLNKGIKLTFGQLLENRAYRQIVNAALSIIGRGTIEFPYSELLGRVYKKTFDKTKSRSEVAFAFQILVGSMLGPQHFNSSFEKHTTLINNEDQTYDYSNLHFILTLIDEVDRQNKINRTKKSYCFKKFVGPMIYDLFTMNRDDMQQKWKEMFHQAYNVISDKELKSLFNVGNNRAKSETTIECISDNVQQFLDGNLDLKSINNSTEDSEEKND